MNKLMQMAAQLRQVGAEGSPDTMLAHITPQEAAMLKAKGGSGRIDPNTGLPHFEDGESSGSGEGYSSSGYGNRSLGESNTDNQGNYGDSAYGGYQKSLTDENGRRGGYADTVGGRIAYAFGGDPFGTTAQGLNLGASILGAFNPTVSIINKLASVALNAGRDDMPSGSTLKSLTGLSGLPSFGVGTKTASEDAPADANTKAQNSSSYARTSSSSRPSSKIKWELV